MKTQIPISRAKIEGYTNENDFKELFDCKCDISGDGYVIGMPKLNEYGTENIMDYKLYDDDGVCIGVESITIDPSTLAIHFKDMIASDSDRLLQDGQKDFRIFASLSEDGKGGDLLFDELCEVSNPCILQKGSCRRYFDYSKNMVTIQSFNKYKVTGIQQ
jgi:hypothetical protein